VTVSGAFYEFIKIEDLRNLELERKNRIALRLYKPYRGYEKEKGGL
jgi:hypothetical protein